MKELTLKEGLLEDSDGVRYERKNPVATVCISRERRGDHIKLRDFEQKILTMQKEGELKKGIQSGNAYCVTGRFGIDGVKTVEVGDEVRTYPALELCVVEIYKLGV
jgi:hypothetical protein